MCLDPGSPIPVVVDRIAAPVCVDDAADANPNHHLWRNGRFWWAAVTVLHDGWRQERIRRSLRTDDVTEARRRRDALFDELDRRRGLVLSVRSSRLHA